MAVEILRHTPSGEYYAVQYHGEPSDENITRCLGPLTGREAIAVFDTGDFVNDDPADAEWARHQSWGIAHLNTYRDE